MAKPSKSEEDFIDDDETQNANQQTGYAWEEEYKRSWDVLKEDEDGSLKRTIDHLQIRKRKRLLRDTSTIRRGIIRHMFLIIDQSEAMLEKDLRPSRLDLTLTYAEQFVLEFFDQNPISQLGIIVSKGGIAEKLTGLSGNPIENLIALRNKKNSDADGEPSLQNSLELARSSLVYAPAHGTREILIIMGSLTSCDPGDIYDTIENLMADNICISIVGLAAEVQICKYMCKKTKGTYGVVLNEAHFKDLLFEIIPPPPVSVAKNDTELVMMGFPSSVNETSPSLCAWYDTACIYRYAVERDKMPFQSFPDSSNPKNVDISSGVYTCPKCKQYFCLDCDAFVHEVIHNCPGCLSTSQNNNLIMDMMDQMNGNGGNGQKEMSIPAADEIISATSLDSDSRVQEGFD
ncbi:14256_t:CDS:2 [Acaulospora colombiana]|uniref:14256_t:CDS:1 n=1 Tax=Acaulospora colombiana TaxID=27376 RepID=A0ACA9L459_9GLOM|nr:14256_t:CDS:2 [Acaulospora colombiana]